MTRLASFGSIWSLPVQPLGVFWGLCVFTGGGCCSVVVEVVAIVVVVPSCHRREAIIDNTLVKRNRF
jgi:hypothetical protein